MSPRCVTLGEQAWYDRLDRTNTERTKVVTLQYAVGAAGITLLFIMAVGPDVIDLVEVIDEWLKSRRGKHAATGAQHELRVTHWMPMHPKVRVPAPAASRVVQDGMMVWPYREDPLTEQTVGMRAVSS